MGDPRQLVTRLSDRNSRTTPSIRKADEYLADREREINEEPFGKKRKRQRKQKNGSVVCGAVIAEGRFVECRFLYN